MLFRRNTKSNERVISDEFGEWILLSNGYVSWTINMLEKAFKKIKLKPIKVYSLYFSVEKGFGQKELVELKAMVVTDRVRLKGDVSKEISKHANASVSTIKLVYDGPVAMWFIDLISLPNGKSNDPYYNMFYPYGTEGSKIPYTIQDLVSEIISSSRNCKVISICKKGTNFGVVANCPYGDVKEYELTEAVKYFADGLEIERNYRTFRLVVKGLKKTRIIPLIWDDLADIPEGC